MFQCDEEKLYIATPDATKTARRRMQLIASGKSKARPCDRPQ
jgi:hypothetical protein